MSTSRVARFFPSLRENIDLNMTIRMFVEDIELGVMPIGGVSNTAPKFAVDIQGSSRSVEHATGILESLAEHQRYSVKELLSDVVRGIARNLAWNSRAVYEIIPMEEKCGAYHLYGFTPRRLFHAFGWYIQVVPKADRGLLKKAYVPLPEKDIWDITMPRVLGGYKGYHATLRELARFQRLGPSFLLQDLSGQGWPAHYDFQRYIREEEFFETKITSLWGWNRRDSSERNWTEFYWSYRTLRFRLAQAYLREHIVDELNRLFRRLGIQAEIVVKGLPTPSEISAIQQRMLEGDISFKEAFDNCSVN